MYCECGCGGLAPLAKCTNGYYGYVKGAPLRFIHGHNARVHHKGMTGRKHTLETRLKMSAQRRGEKHWNWQGGISEDHESARKTFEYREWRTAVFERDDYTCQNSECLQYGGELHAHHIKPFAQYPELRYVIDNGMTLCAPCHGALTWG